MENTLKQAQALGKLHIIDFPEDFRVHHYSCEKKCKSIEDMQYHESFEFGVCLEGQGIFFIGNQMIPFTQGNITIIPPKVPHFAQSLDTYPSRWLFIAFDTAVATSPIDGIVPNVVCDKAMLNMLNLISDELNAKNNGYELAVSSLLDVLLIRAARLQANAPTIFTYSDDLSAVYPAIEYISQHYRESFDIETLATKCNMSLTHFRRKFTSVTGVPPLKYLLIMRLRLAGILLSLTNRKISDIALDVGYNTLSSFNRHFKENYKMSPKDYRSLAESGKS